MTIVRNFQQIEFNLFELLDNNKTELVNPELYENFGTINTCADGNCFFHGCVMITKVYNRADNTNRTKDFIEGLRKKIANSIDIKDDYEYIKNDLVLPLENNDEIKVVTKFRQLHDKDEIIEEFTNKKDKINAIKTLIKLQEYDEEFYDELNTELFESFINSNSIEECKYKFSKIILEKCKETLENGNIDKNTKEKCNNMFKNYIEYLFDIIISSIIDSIKKSISKMNKWIDTIKNTSQATLSQKYLQKYLRNNIIIIQKLEDSDNATIYILCEDFDFDRPSMILLTDSTHFERVVRKNPKGKVKYTSLFKYDDTPFVKKLYKISCEDDINRQKYLEKKKEEEQKEIEEESGQESDDDKEEEKGEEKNDE